MRRTTNTGGLVLAAAVAAAAGCTAGPAGRPEPYRPVATVLELMESVIAHAAEEYWGAVSVAVGEQGATENAPATDEEWEEVWAAAIALAESGNLLMMPTRTVDDGDWVRYSQGLVDVGVEAARAAQARDADAVREVGERVYNVCLDCHQRYVPELAERDRALAPGD